MLFVVFVTSFLIITKQCRSQQCVSTNFKLAFKNTISSADYRPLLVIQDTNYGITFHKCLHLCSQSEQCIGFFLCKEKENLFVCQTCCEWKKIKGYSLGNSPDCKYIEKGFTQETNLAFNKTAILSSEYGKNHSASNAVDGIKICPYGLRAGSDYSVQPWLMIDLGDTYDVQKIVIYARNDYYALQLDAIRVAVIGGNVNYTCGGEYPGPTSENDVILFMCPPEVRGNKAIIMKTTTDHLTVCEVEVYG
ncbi:uncharacterized protein LOC128159806 [Crassostrea angulata]|uniref:uncharacterized protein LOC128159806 n=1 Tax=Magallana angulata TaxID=2784310 RepID=UPI0022B1B26D|nr:uncharacterized protein LOC128159806 [Crassostrea angulata]